MPLPLAWAEQLLFISSPNSLLGWSSPVVTGASQFKTGSEHQEIVGIDSENQG